MSETEAPEEKEAPADAGNGEGGSYWEKEAKRIAAQRQALKAELAETRSERDSLSAAAKERDDAKAREAGDFAKLEEGLKAQIAALTEQNNSLTNKLQTVETERRWESIENDLLGGLDPSKRKQGAAMLHGWRVSESDKLDSGSEDIEAAKGELRKLFKNVGFDLEPAPAREQRKGAIPKPAKDGTSPEAKRAAHEQTVGVTLFAG